MFLVKVVLVYSHPLLAVFCRWDDNGHGTHVAGTAAGSIHGVARNAIVHAVKVIQGGGGMRYGLYAAR